MFTGIVEEMGAVQAMNRGGKSSRISILAKTVLQEMKEGDSISVNGVCLTAVEITEKEFSADVSPETLRVTDLGNLKPGDAVNLEQAVRVNSRLGGHLVTGHVDGIGVIRDRRKTEDAIFLVCELPPDLMKYCISKGSIAIDGVSLTVNRVGTQEVELAIIPHTAEVTTLGLKTVGMTVNLECDLIGKYIERLMQERPGVSNPSQIDEAFLRKKGLL
ncbi:MAG TPA: riboflavin synthase [Nitrospiria bacterium]|nr:riboflavin synthase [Nitrospiria bacterium]